jgi:hypothetical protein
VGHGIRLNELCEVCKSSQIVVNPIVLGNASFYVSLDRDVNRK